MIATGWYRKAELTITAYQVGKHSKRYRLTGKRTTIHNQYSYIPLHIMARYAEKTGIKFKGKFKDDYVIPTDLQALRAELDSYVDAGRSSPNDWINRQDTAMQRIRHHYFHFSADCAGIGMDPEWSGNQRTRVIQNG